MFLQLTNGEGVAVLANFDLVEQVSVIDKAQHLRSKLHFSQSVLYVREDYQTIQQLLQRRQME